MEKIIETVLMGAERTVAVQKCEAERAERHVKAARWRGWFQTVLLSTCIFIAFVRSLRTGSTLTKNMKGLDHHRSSFDVWWH